ncbi:ATP-binding cassette domain-containing protein, partial [Phycisphaerales bacterium]|nr:ATP-binding cassette domain-containing protein [Phycisphaerales bacterium]
MSNLLSARHLTKSYPSNVLFEDVAIQLVVGDRVGLIGPNGAGKSTLMKVLVGVEDADEGELIRRKGSKLVYVAQDDRFESDATPLSAVTAELSSDSDDRVDGDTRAAIVLSKLGFTDFDRSVSTLSGGWRKRLSLACALV